MLLIKDDGCMVLPMGHGGMNTSTRYSWAYEAPSGPEQETSTRLSWSKMDSEW